MTLVHSESPHILVLDSETFAWEVLRHGLGDGYRVSAVATRSAAIRVLNSDSPVLLIVELLLSKALGLPLAIHVLRRDIPVVMTTSNYDLARCLRRLGCVVLRKPFLRSELRECVEHTLENADENLLRFRTALGRLRMNTPEREAVLRLFGSMRDQALLAFNSHTD